jgi:FAD/FMN-containing dehydrogenase
MAQFNKITYNNATSSVSIGAGCIFDEVYRDKGLIGADRNIVGCNDTSVGVAGWLLGGGYSMMKTSRFGLGIDNVEAYRVVVPRGDKNAKLKRVQRNGAGENKQNLFWALKENASRISLEVDFLSFQLVQGGGNNFGIVTEFTLATHPQESRVYVSSS